MTELLEQKYVGNLIKLRDWLLANREIVQNHLDFGGFIDTDVSGLNDVRHSRLYNALYDLEFSDGKNEKIPLSYFKSNECRTNCCLVGWAGISKLFEHQPSDNWCDFTERNFGVVYDDGFIGSYLFGSSHQPILDDAIERINYVITNRTLPHTFTEIQDWNDD